MGNTVVHRVVSKAAHSASERRKKNTDKKRTGDAQANRPVGTEK
jgi:hypothetical protein